MCLGKSLRRAFQKSSGDFQPAGSHWVRNGDNILLRAYGYAIVGHPAVVGVVLARQLIIFMGILAIGHTMR